MLNEQIFDLIFSIFFYMNKFGDLNILTFFYMNIFGGDIGPPKIYNSRLTFGGHTCFQYL